MSGYTQADISAVVAGSKRANEMKAEIELILNLLLHQIARANTVRKVLESLTIPVEIQGEVCSLSIAENRFREIAAFFTVKSVEMSILGAGESRVSGLSLAFVKSIHSALPLLVQEAVNRFPGVGEIIEQLCDLA